MGHYEFLFASLLATRTESRTRTRALTRAALDPYGDQNLKLPFHNNRFQRRHISSLKKFPFHTRFKISGTVTTLPGPAPRPQSTIIPTLPTMKHHARRKSSPPQRRPPPMPAVCPQCTPDDASPLIALGAHPRQFDHGSGALIPKVSSLVFCFLHWVPKIRLCLPLTL